MVITGQRLLPNFSGVTAMLFLMSVTLLYATGFHFLFERRTGQIKRLIDRFLEYAWTKLSFDRSRGLRPSEP
jgi:hypothetical protein